MFRVLRWTASAVMSIAAAAPAHSEHRLTASEVREIALKVGMPLQIGHAGMPSTPSTQRDQSISRQQVKQWLDEASLRTARANRFGQQQRNEAVRTGKPVVHDVTDDNIGPPPGRLATPPDTNYGPQLEARAQKMFGLGSTREKEEWMADQEQRAIANEINRSKPLLYPVNSR
jgi:hypothetical protein